MWRGKGTPSNKIGGVVIKQVKHLESFPVMERQSRQSTKGQYLDSKLSIDVILVKRAV